MATPEATPEKDIPKWVKTFLAHFADTGNATLSARKAKVNRQYVYRYRGENEWFAELWKQAEAEAVEVMEGEAHRRAVKGCLEPIFHAGRKVGTVKRFSDTLLIFLLKARKPETYRDNARVVVAGDAENPLQVKGEHECRHTLTPDDLAAAERLEQAAADRGVHPDR